MRCAAGCPRGGTGDVAGLFCCLWGTKALQGAGHQHQITTTARRGAVVGQRGEAATRLLTAPLRTELSGSLWEAGGQHLSAADESCFIHLKSGIRTCPDKSP